MAPVLGQSAPASPERVDHDIKYLASDELEGREPGSKGIEVAAQYIIDEFKESGVASGVPDGSYRQPFEINMGTNVDKEATRLVFTEAEAEESTLELAIETDFQPMMVGGAGEVTDAELVFVGYGIEDQENNYLEYRDLDVEGKVVVFIRLEPQQADAESVFDGAENSPNAAISRKLELAVQKGAAGAILVNDGVRAADDASDELAQPSQFGRQGELIPFFHVKRSVFEKLLARSPIVKADGTELTTLAAIEKEIDTDLSPLSQPLKAWRVTANAGYTARNVTTSNIVGVVEGEGPHADETIIIGGHYDHLGYGGYGSNAPGRTEIHNGADDNATGTAGVVELARRFASAGKKPGRRLVFIAFSGEERGLLGSAHYVENPIYPLENTIAMVNYDMIGRLRESKLTIFGTGTAAVFDSLVEKANDPGKPLELDKQPSPFAGSDHMPFVRAQIPVLFLHTGLTEIYHTPEDDYETLNVDGAVQVIDYTERLIRELADAEEKPVYVDMAREPRRSRAWLGARLDYEKDERGATVEEVPAEAPAATAGLQVGDVILSIDGNEIKAASDLTSLLADKEPGDKIEVKYVRGEEELNATVELGRSPRRGRQNRDE
jgi:hypothetical protein